MKKLDELNETTSIKDLEKLSDNLSSKIKTWKVFEFTFTWIVPLLFLILVFGHEYGALFLIPMAVCLPAIKISETKVEDYRKKQRQCYSRIGDLESQRAPDAVNAPDSKAQAVNEMLEKHLETIKNNATK